MILENRRFKKLKAKVGFLLAFNTLYIIKVCILFSQFEVDHMWMSTQTIHRLSGWLTFLTCRNKEKREYGSAIPDYSEFRANLTYLISTCVVWSCLWYRAHSFVANYCTSQTVAQYDSTHSDTTQLWVKDIHLLCRELSLLPGWHPWGFLNRNSTTVHYD